MHPKRHRLSVGLCLPLAIALLAVLASACFVERDPLTKRICRTDLGCDDGETCARGYCETIPCAEDSDCDDGLFCNGAEICDLENPDSDVRGCLPGVELELDDGLACTQDSCDEDADIVLHDDSDCECFEDEDCPADDTPCQRQICQDFSCVTEALPVDTECDDGAGCTLDDTCDNEGICTGTPSDAECADNRFCNGEETCEPTSEASDRNGCVAGVEIDVDDGVDCTIDSCNEAGEVVVNDPSGCTCDTDEDCTAPPCMQATCSEALTCVVTPVEAGTSCDDGLACTSDDACNDQGACVGVPNDNLCSDGVFCNGEESCDPADPNSDQIGCANGADPISLFPPEPDCVELSCDEDNDAIEINRLGCPDFCNGQPDGEPCEIACGQEVIEGVCLNRVCGSTLEGRTGDPSCSDGIDNDCDNLTDLEDTDCLVPTQLSIIAPGTAPVGLNTEGASFRVIPTSQGQGVTNQATNLYCVSRIVAHEESFDETPQENVQFRNENNEPQQNQPAQIRFGQPFSNDPGAPLGADICEGFSLIYGPFDMPPIDEAVYSYILTADLGHREGQLDEGQYFVMSYRTAGTNERFVPLYLVGSQNAEGLARVSFALFNGESVESLEVRFEVISVEGDREGQCGFVNDVRLELSPSPGTENQGDRAYPQWRHNNITEDSHQDFEDLQNVASFFIRSTLPNSNHQLSIREEASISDEGLSYRFSNGTFGFIRLPLVQASPVHDRANPLILEMDSRLTEADLSQDEVVHVAVGHDIPLNSLANLRRLTRLASVMPPNTGPPSHYVSHFDLNNNRAFENRIKIVLPEDARPLLDRQFGFLKAPTSASNERLNLDNIQLYVHTAPTAHDVSVISAGPEEHGSSRHIIRLRHALPGEARVQCFWQRPGLSDTPTIPSEPVRILFTD